MSFLAEFVRLWTKHICWFSQLAELVSTSTADIQRTIPSPPKFDHVNLSLFGAIRFFLGCLRPRILHNVCFTRTRPRRQFVARLGS